ncbi:hypothetical protein L7F22_061407 [Adiantum nelumboides]|nr:hypothetical protein [Adiantum nelumboides]
MEPPNGIIATLFERKKKEHFCPKKNLRWVGDLGFSKFTKISRYKSKTYTGGHHSVAAQTYFACGGASGGREEHSCFIVVGAFESSVQVLHIELPYQGLICLQDLRYPLSEGVLPRSMPSAWSDNLATDHVAANNTEKSSNNLSSADNSGASRAPPARSSYVPPHLRRAQGEPKASSEPVPANISGSSSGGAWGGGGISRGYGSRGGGGAAPSGGASSSSNSWSGRSSWGGGRREENPFANDEASDETLFQQENTGINFEAYDDIPVETSGENVPPPVSTFAEIDMGPAVNENIRRCKYVKPTPVQRYAIPISIAGRDLMACAQTGSGKTAAFCFPIIAGILSGPPLSGRPPRGSRTVFPLALILSPTRELSMQIHEEAKKFAYQTGLRVVVAYGGAPITQQLRELERGVDILVATPGRLSDLLERARVSLSQVRYLALDEADRMLDMGFEPQIRKIVEQMDMPRAGDRQTMLFSATFPREIQRLAADFLSSYIFLAVGRVGSSTDLIVQKVEFVPDHDKRSMLMDLIHSQNENGIQGVQPGKQPLTLVFVETKRGADSLEDWLCRNGFPATTIHGDRTQQEREYALRSFRTGATPILVATDVAARGLDIPDVAHVINFDLPNDIDDYVHRIGRTGRAGKSGLATAFFNENNVSLARPLVELMQEANQTVPDWLVNYAARANFGGGGGRNRRTGGGSRFGGRDYRREGGSRGGSGAGGGYGASYGGNYGGSSGYSNYGGGASSAWD